MPRLYKRDFIVDSKIKIFIFSSVGRLSSRFPFSCGRFSRHLADVLSCLHLESDGGDCESVTYVTESSSVSCVSLQRIPSLKK